MQARSLATAKYRGLQEELRSHPEYIAEQLANARRFGIALDAYPTLLRIDANCGQLAAFAAAAPQAQPDAT